MKLDVKGRTDGALVAELRRRHLKIRRELAVAEKIERELSRRLLEPEKAAEREARSTQEWPRDFCVSCVNGKPCGIKHERFARARAPYATHAKWLPLAEDAS